MVITNIISAHMPRYLRRAFRNERVTKFNGQQVVNTFMPPFPSLAFERLMKKSLDVNRHRTGLYSAHIALTNECGFNCWHCSSAYRQGKEVAAHRWIEVIKELQDIGISVIGLTGGEPLRRNGLEAIIKSIDARSTSVLFTAGEGLDDDRAKRLKAAGLYYVVISLDHYDEKEHNRLRGSGRAFLTAINAVKVSIKNGFYTAIQLTARKDITNFRFLYKYLNFADSLGVQEIRIGELMPAGRLINEKADIFFGERDRDILKKFHREANKDSSLPKVAAFAYIEDRNLYGCCGGRYHIYIDASGNVCPCDFTPLSFGNIRKENFKNVLQRLRRRFTRPRTGCFISDNIDMLRPLFEKNLPLSYEASRGLCADLSGGSLPLAFLS